VRGEAAEETIETPWLIGCDGPHSTVRHELNQPFIGEEYPESFLLANVKLLWLLKDDESYDFVHEGRVLKVLPLPEGNYRLIADATDDQVNGDSNLTITDWQTIVDEHVPQRAKVTVLSWSGRYRIHRKLVSGLREGRVFLVGDAAHIHSPTGAQGMNTGIQDAFNLSWKLALVAGGFADESLLDSYHSERYPIEKSVLAASDLPLHVLGITNPIGKAVRDTFMPLISGLELVQQKARNFVSELSVQYSDSSIVEDVSFGGEPSAGERAPNVMVQNIDNSLRPLFSLTRQPGFTALLFDPVGRPFSTAHTYSQITSILQRRLKDNAAIYRITSGAGGSINIADIKVIVDTSDVAAQRYQARHGAFYLIRPDGYISFRSSLETAASRLEPHLDRLLGP
jgi:3-(3-hydroxy-phenyl)propionate hydroxylase